MESGKPLPDRFFDVLRRIQSIHEQSKRLLLESGQQTAAIEIMDMMAKREEQAFDLLYRWLIDAVRTLNWDQISNPISIMNGFAHLQKRRVPYRYCLDEYGVLRRGVLVKQFLTYLNRSQMLQPSSTSPISSNSTATFHSTTNSSTSSAHAHTETAIAGILQWIEQAVTNEKLLLNKLLSHCDLNQSEQDNDVKDYLSLITATICQAGKSRIEQLLAFETDCVVSYRVRNTLKRHQKEFAHVLNKQSEFMFFLNELCALSHRVFVNNLNFFFSYRLGRKSSNEDDLEEVSSNLSPTCSFVTCNQILAETLRFDACLTDVEKQELAINILNVSIGSYLNWSDKLSRNLNDIERSIFLINCFQSVLITLRDTGYTEEFVQTLSGELEREKTALSNSQCESVLKYCELNAIWQWLHSIRTSIMTGNSCDSSKAHEAVACVPGCDALSLKGCARKLSSYLESHKTFVSAQFLLIKDKAIRLEIERKSRSRFFEAYSQIHECVHDPKSGYDEPNSILPLNPTCVRETLQV